ncbi:hypothetical protein NP233_g10721 [Leucocoprinus birnbaumii]|uniref:Cytochrome P450 n=1 Tax=Leucocoprinus birnbaumii TaxID=56174 RepID=A0AAD5YPK0_9AGAR|nr:hypothetical protein NP233_g10721 [Leucocoprinus birnbaumii]
MMAFGLRDLAIICVTGSIYFLYHYRRRNRHPLPPRLRGWPIVGNAFQLPLTFVHLFYQDLGRKLGSKIICAEALGQTIIVINDAQIAIDLLEKRSTIYSSRPPIRMLVEVIGAKWFFGLLPYGEEWRSQRRIFQQHFSTKFTPREQETATRFIQKGLLANLYQDPQKFNDHVEECIGGLSLSMTYGLPVRRFNDPLMHESTEAVAIAMGASSPGKYLVNVIPALKYVPKWFPGAGFKRWAPVAHSKLLAVMNSPFDQTLKCMNDGTAPESFVSASLAYYKGREDFEVNKERIKQAASQIFLAAADSTTASVMTFILTMLKYPEVQRKAQREVDSVVGFERLPDYSDRENLPYLTAVLKEVIRWNPISPMGVPHLTNQDDVHEGYHIPKEAIVMANAYAILQDEASF